jgi:RNA polymerase sigma factor (TIGR02999 family)
MSELTRILLAIEEGDANAPGQLLPLVYEELRKLASARLKHEKPGQTLQATALVHEAYLRLLGPDEEKRWSNRSHFFAAAAEAMRRILVEEARRKRSIKHGGQIDRHDLDDAQIAAPGNGVDVLELNEALDQLADRDAEAADLVKLRFFTGMTMAEAAEALGLSVRTAERVWTYARSFLRKQIREDPS